MSATATRSRLKPATLARNLEGEPLIGVTAASKLLGIPAPNFKRDAAPHLTAVPVEGSANVYFRSEVQALADERALRRK
jgi:hypothetical protein